MTLSTYLLHKRSESNYPFIPQYLDTALNKIIIIIIKNKTEEKNCYEEV